MRLIPAFSLAVATISVVGISWAENGAPFTERTELFKSPTAYFPHNWHKALAADDEWQHPYISHNQGQGFGGGISARDINGDYRVDLVSLFQGGANIYLQTPEGVFERDKQVRGGNAGTLLADINQDGHIDLVTGESAYFPPEKDKVPIAAVYRIFLGPDWERRRDCRPLTTDQTGRNIYSFAMGDANLDGKLDIATANWSRASAQEEPRLWLSEGGCQYQPASVDHGLYGHFGTRDFTFTPTFSDLTNNGWPDLLLASDFETSQYFINTGNGRYKNQTNPMVISDQNGMGSAVADFDNDGLMDWFVTSIYDVERGENVIKSIYGHWGGLGNRFYHSLGNGQFEDTTEQAGVADGAWGWGACAADFNNDGHLDIYHVNGFLSDELEYHPDIDGKFSGEPSRLFLNNGNGSFREAAAEWGLDEPNEGRGVVCFDHGRDGDIDIAYSQAYGKTRLFLNRSNDTPENFGNYFGVIPQGVKGNLSAAGAKVYIFPETGDHQVREIQVGGNFLGQHPPEAHFGLGEAENINTVLIQWPGKPARYTTLRNIRANQWIVANHPERVKAGGPEWEPLPESAKVAP